MNREQRRALRGNPVALAMLPYIQARYGTGGTFTHPELIADAFSDAATDTGALGDLARVLVTALVRAR